MTSSVVARRRRTFPPRRQPPVHSPLPSTAWTRAWTRLSGNPREQLAARLRERYAAEGVLLTDSGTTALRLAIRAATPGGGTVALPSFSCYDLATAAVGADARVALYDLDPATLGPDLTSLDAVLTAGVAAVVVAPLYGVPVEWAAIEDVAARHGAVLIEDAAQGHGASYRGQRLGSFGRLSVLSFGRGKGWTGSGGGALLWRGPPPALSRVDDAGVADTLRAAVMGLAQSWLSRPGLYWIPASIPGLGLGETHYRAPGAVGAMAAFQAALLLETEGPADREASTRRSRAAALREAVADHQRLPHMLPDAVPGYLRFPILVHGGLDGLREPEVAVRLGIAGSYPTPLDRVPAIRDRLEPGLDRWSGGEHLARDLITVPVHQGLTFAEVRRSIRLLQR